MFNPSMLDEIAKTLAGLVPEGARELQRDVEKNFRSALQNTFNKLELVTREEFEVQQKVLLRTRSKLEELEKQVVALEQRLNAQP